MSVTLETDSFLSANGESKVFYDVYTPENGEVKGILQISHGMCEHMGRYEAFARSMCQHGFLVCGNDHIGHGRSTDQDENLGFFAKSNGWSHLVDDLNQLTDIIQKKYPGTPYYLMGHSMGSFVARVYLTRYGDKLTGAILSGTAGPNPATGFAKIIASTLRALKGEQYRSKFLDSLAFGSYNNRYENKRTKYEWLSRDPAVIDLYMKDKYCTYLFTVSAFYDLFTLIDMVSKPEWARSVPKKMPIFLMSGDMDPVGDYGKGVRMVYERLKKTGCNVRLKLYADGRHEMINETNKDLVYEDVLHFMKTGK